jgi:hypothetical protein
MIRMLTAVAISSSLMISPMAYADCTDVISLSKTISQKTADKNSFESSAKAFCSEYKKGTTQTKSANYGISYGYIAASMGTAKASEEQIASQVCSSEEGKDVKKDVYKEYIETISANAYTAYEACERLRTSSISIEPQDKLSTEVSFLVQNARPSTAPALMQYSATLGVSCLWESDGSDSKKFSLVTGASVTLRCKRENASKKGSVTILDTSVAANNSLTIPWGTYDKDDNPVDQLLLLNKKLTEAMDALANTTALLKGGVIAFESTTCPVGWLPYAPAYGKFIRGIDVSDARIDPDGKRAPGSSQGESFAKHSHTMTLPGRSGNNAFVNRPAGWGNDNDVRAAQSAPTDEVGGAETRPKNVALLYCQQK